MTRDSSPGRDLFGSTVSAFDERVDAAFEQLRGHRVADEIFRRASDLGDFSLIWHAVNLARGAVLRRPGQVAGLTMGLALESLIVNQGIKRLVRRARPTASGDARTPVRQPSTSSFPSGHASAAAFNATVLTAWSPRGAPLWWGLAGIVAASRVHVRIHHASDVVGGAVVGVAMGLLARRVLGRFGVTS